MIIQTNLLEAPAILFYAKRHQVLKLPEWLLLQPKQTVKHFSF